MRNCLHVTVCLPRWLKDSSGRNPSKNYLPLDSSHPKMFFFEKKKTCGKRVGRQELHRNCLKSSRRVLGILVPKLEPGRVERETSSLPFCLGHVDTGGFTARMDHGKTIAGLTCLYPLNLFLICKFRPCTIKGSLLSSLMKEECVKLWKFFYRFPCHA